MWQEIAIVLVALGVIGYLAVKIYQYITIPQKHSPCAGCSGCTLIKEVQKKKKK